MKNKEWIINNIVELRQAIENGVINQDEIVEELIEIELQIQNYL